MFTGCHHVAYTTMDARPFEAFMQNSLGISPVVKLPNGELLYRIGPSVLEIFQLRGHSDRFSRRYEHFQRNGGRPWCHVAWLVADIDKCLREITLRGAQVEQNDDPVSPYGAVMSPLGGYLLANLAVETTNGVWFQLAETIAERDLPAVVERYRSHYATRRTDGSWLHRPSGLSALKHVHHVSHIVWGLEFIVGYMRDIFGMEPATREDRSDAGMRGAVYVCGPTVLRFEEPTSTHAPEALLAPQLSYAAGYPGGGISEVGWSVDNIQQCVDELRSSGVEFVEDEPTVSRYGGYTEVTVNPAATAGIAMKLCEDLGSSA